MSAWNLPVIFLLLVLNGFFVAVEFAVIASRRTKLEAHGGALAQVALEAMKKLNLHLAGAQLGITMASLALGYVAEPTVATLLERSLGSLVDLPEGVMETLGFALAIGVVAFLHMVVGEMVPKNIAIAAPERTLMAVAVPYRVYVTLFEPVLRLLNAMGNALVRRCGVEPRDELATAASAVELVSMLGSARGEDGIEEVARRLLTGAATLTSVYISEVMVPREKIVWLPRTATPAEAEALVVASGRTRLVLAGDGLDDVRGLVHAKDLLLVPEDARDQPLPPGSEREIETMGPGTSLDVALLTMQKTQRHLAVVCDAAGRTLGIATLEDVIERLLGGAGGDPAVVRGGGVG